jgi:hypothetical protein
MKNIKKIIREEIEDFDDLEWIRNISGELPEINDQNKYLALVELLGVEEVFGDIVDLDDTSESGFEENGWTHYGIDTFTLNNGEVWAVGTQQEFDDALEQYWRGYFDDVGYGSIRDIGDYITMSDTDRHMWASSEADYYVGDLSDMELLEIANLEDEYNELEEEMETLDSELYDTDDEDEEDRIKGEIKELERKKTDLIRSAKEVVNEITYNEWYDCLSDPYECLVRERGWYSNANDLLSNTSFHVDEDRLVRESVNNSDWGVVSNWDGEYHEIGDYVAIRVE